MTEGSRGHGQVLVGALIWHSTRMEVASYPLNTLTKVPEAISLLLEHGQIMPKSQ